MVAAVCIALGVIASGFVMGYLVTKSDEPVKDYRDVGGNIDIEYYNCQALLNSFEVHYQELTNYLFHLN